MHNLSDTDDVLFAVYEKRGVYLHTPHGRTHFPGALVGWVNRLAQTGCKLEKADRYVAVNASKITSVESGLFDAWAYFDKDKKIKCRVSNAYYKNWKKREGEDDLPLALASV